MQKFLLILFFIKLTFAKNYLFLIEESNLILISNYGMNWFKSKSFCDEHSMELLSIYNQKDQDQIERIMKKYRIKRVWLSGNNFDNKGSIIFKWANGTIIDSKTQYTNWFPGRPTDDEYRQTIDVVSKNQYKWGNWIPYERANVVICKIKINLNRKKCSEKLIN